MSKTIVLLDLNFTLVSNSLDANFRASQYESQIAKETYRTDLIELIRHHHVCLVTVRHKRYEAQTLARINELTGWQPQEAFFRDIEASPVKWKSSVLKLLKEREAPDTCFLAIESNDDNAAMYVKHGVLSLKVWGGQHRSESVKPTTGAPSELI